MTIYNTLHYCRSSTRVRRTARTLCIKRYIIYMYYWAPSFTVSTMYICSLAHAATVPLLSYVFLEMVQVRNMGTTPGTLTHEVISLWYTSIPQRLRRLEWADTNRQQTSRSFQYFTPDLRQPRPWSPYFDTTSTASKYLLKIQRLTWLIILTASFLVHIESLLLKRLPTGCKLNRYLMVWATTYIHSAKWPESAK